MALKDRIFGAEGHWLMGRVIPRQFLDELDQRFVDGQG